MSTRTANLIEKTQKYQGEVGQRRAKDVLLTNSLVCNDDKIALDILTSGEIVGVSKGEDIIVEGQHKDDVFFLLEGTVTIVVGGTEIAFRKTPTQIGEMAAQKPGEVRTATVRAHTEEAIFLKLEGSVFRDFLSKYPNMDSRLNDDLMERFRERISKSNPVAKTKNFWGRYNKAIISTFVSIYFFYLVWLSGIDLRYSVGIGILSGGCTFALLSFFSPENFWRRRILLSSSILVGVWVPKYFDLSSIIKTILPAGEIQILIIAFTDGMKQLSLAEAALFSLIALILIFIFSHYDAKQNKAFY